MRHYEQILNKIAPTFYKLLQYYDYSNTTQNLSSTLSYLSKATFPKVFYIEIPLQWIDRKYFSMQAIEKPIYYYNANDFPFKKGNVLYINIVAMNKIYRFNNTFDHYAYLDEFIINLIINKFSFENERIMLYEIHEKYDNTYKDLFIALVGKDMYETIRNNIK